MKKKIKEEIRAKSVTELQKAIETKQSEIIGKKLDLKVGKLKNTSFLRIITDELAFLKTILREKELVEERKTK